MLAKLKLSERRDKVIKDLLLIYIGVIIGIVSTLFVKGCKGDDE